MTHVYYVCPVLPPGFVTLKDDDGNDVIEEVGWRPKISDLLDGVERHRWSADIPNVSRTDGTPAKPWCIVSVEVDQAVHDALETDPEIWPVKPDGAARRDVRSFLRDKGESNPPDGEQEILTRLHPVTEDGHVPQIANLNTRPLPDIRGDQVTEEALVLARIQG